MLVIEAARLDEVDRLVDLAYRHLERDIDAAWLGDHVAQGACIVARNVVTDHVVGFAVARREEGCQCQLLALAVDREYRSQGIGAALLRAVREQMVQTGAMSMHLQVRSDNGRAQAFYARHGFAPRGVAGAYADGEPALEFQRPL